MEPRIFPFWEPRPQQELDPALRQAVEAVRDEPVPGSALEQALLRAGSIPERTPVRRPWSVGRRTLVAGISAAASLLLGLGFWAILSSIPVGDNAGTGPTPVRLGIARGMTDAERELANTSGTFIEYDVVRDPPARPASRPAGAVRESPPATDADGPPTDNPFQAAAQCPLATLPTAADAASYTDVRRFLLQEKVLPPPDAVRVAELINAFSYAYAAPADEQPLALTLNLVECPWNRQHHLVRVGLRGRESDGLVRGVIARDVSFQVEFNPQRVAAYRLLGHERCASRAGDVQRDSAIEAGHSFTALFEIIPAAPAGASGKWLTARLRYREPDGESGKLLTQALAGGVVRLTEAPADVRFAAALAEFGLLLRGAEHGDGSFASVRKLAGQALAESPDPRQAEFLEMVEAAESLATGQ